MKEQIISFETAKVAKEKGFDILCPNYFFEDGEFRENNLTGTNGYYGEDYQFEQEEFLENWNNKFLTKKNGDRCFGCNKSEDYFETYSAPTQSLLQKWLREIYNFNIKIDDFLTKNDKVVWDFEICLIGTDLNEKGEYIALKSYDVNRSFKTYEEALEKGLYHALKLIK